MTSLSHLAALLQAANDLYTTAAMMRVHPVPFAEHLALVDAVDRHRHVFESSNSRVLFTSDETKESEPAAALLSHLLALAQAAEAWRDAEQSADSEGYATKFNALIGALAALRSEGK